MNRRGFLCAAVLAGLLIHRGASPAWCQQTVTVFAAASLTEPFRELGIRFERSHPGLTVRFNFAGSQQLALQLQQGAQADVFASADERWMQAVRDSGLTGEAPRIFTRNRLVVIIPRTNPGKIQRLEDLARPGLKLVLAAEAVPVGRYSRQALGRLAQQPGFGSDYANRVLANVVSLEENVKGVVAKVQLGEADGGIVYQSDVTTSVNREVLPLAIPDAGNVIASYPIASLKASASSALAGEFLTLVFSPEGQRTLAQFGLLPVAAESGP